MTQVARRMGFSEAFPYRCPGEIFAEHVALSAFEIDAVLHAHRKAGTFAGIAMGLNGALTALVFLILPLLF